MNREAALTAAYYAALFFAYGAHLPYWPVWLSEWGLSEAEIGLYLGLAALPRIAGSVLVPALADRYALRRPAVAVTAFATVAVFLAHLAIEERGWLMAATLIAAFAMAPAVPLGEALGLRAATRTGFAYAPIRAAGSVAFLVMNVGMGAAIGRLGADAVIFAVAISFTAVGALALVHPGGGAPPGGGADRSRWSEAAGLLRQPVMLCFALAVAFNAAGHVVLYLYATLDWQAQGISAPVIGWLWATGVIAETVLLLGPGRRIAERIGPARALQAAAAAGALRWLVMSVAPPLAVLWPVQALHALTFALAHLGAMSFIAAAIPPRLAASTQGFVSGLIGGIAMAVASAVAARLVAAGGISAAYWLSVALTILSFAAAVALARLWQGGRIAD